MIHKRKKKGFSIFLFVSRSIGAIGLTARNPENRHRFYLSKWLEEEKRKKKTQFDIDMAHRAALYNPWREGGGGDSRWYKKKKKKRK